MSDVLIDYLTYKLPKKNYHRKSIKKERIIIGNSFSFGMNHFNGWCLRHDGNYKNTAAYTITKNGEIYNHFNPKYYSEFLRDKKLDKPIIPIVLENMGWFIRSNNGGFINCNGVKDNGDLKQIKWRGYEYWGLYTDEQYKSLILLCKKLFSDFNIQNKCIGHNTKDSDIYKYNGVGFRSNYESLYTDLNPTFDYENFKKDIEND